MPFQCVFILVLKKNVNQFSPLLPSFESNATCLCLSHIFALLSVFVNLTPLSSVTITINAFF